MGWDILGDVIQAAGSLIGTNQTNQKNWDIAQANNQWSAQQYATRYQTTVKDLEAAGLNPMLAYSQGAGTPPTASQVAPMQNALGNATEAFNKSRSTTSAIDLQRQQVEQSKAQVGLTNAQSAKTAAETMVAQKQAELIDEDVKKRRLEQPSVAAQTKAFEGQATASAASAAQSYKMIENLNEQINKLREEAKRIKQESDKSLPESEFAKKYPSTYLFLDKWLPTISGTLRSIPK